MSTTTEYDAETEHTRPERDIETIEQECTSFIRGMVDQSAMEGVVVALSGGVDSTTAVTLTVRALGPQSVYGLVMPTDSTPDRDTTVAQNVAFDLRIPFRTIEIEPLVEHCLDAMTVVDADQTAGTDSSARIADLLSTSIIDRPGYTTAVGNVGGRLRMLAVYFEANTTNRLVLGTTNRTEHCLGYFTRHDDGGVDLLPLGELYKTDVYRLAQYLDLPDHIIQKPSTAGQWADRTDEDELGATYETIDAILQKMIDDGCNIEETATALSVESDLVARFVRMHNETAHTRSLPPTPATHRQEEH